MGASASTIFHDFSQEEKAEISRVLQSKYLELKEETGQSPTDTLLFDALKNSYNETATKIFEKHGIHLKSTLDETVKQRKPFQTTPPETEEELSSSSPSNLRSVDPQEEIPNDSRGIDIARTASNATDDDEYEFSLRNSFTIQSPNTTISKIERKNNLLKAKTSTQLLSMVSENVLDDKEKIATFINQLKAGDIQTKGLTEFRQRRLTYSQQTVTDEPSPVKTPRPPKSRTTIFASSEIGVVQEKKPPFPANILGTYSCHGIEPSLDDTETIHEKINQDRGCIVYPYNSKKNEALFMVLDGHGEHGDKVSEFVMRQIVVSLEKDPELNTNPPAALKNSYITTNTALLVTDIHYMTSGCTCVTIYLKENTMYVANAGDSRAVMARKDTNGEFVAHNLTRDHKPDDPEEQERIEKWGGFVCPPYEDGLSARVYLDPHFTMIGLAMSRSIGDHAVKNVGVIPEPEVKIFEIDEYDQFMIMASDGVWEFISSQEAVDIVKTCLSNGLGVPEACQELIETAAARWQEEEGDYRDDITAIVIRFPLPNFTGLSAAATTVTEGSG